MATKLKGNTAIISYIGLVVLVYGLFLPILNFICRLFFGSADAALSMLIARIPFGMILGDLINGVCSVFTTRRLSGIILQSQGNINPTYLVQECIKACIVILAYKPMSTALCRVVGVEEPTGYWSRRNKTLVTAVAAALCAVLIPIPMGIFKPQMDYIVRGLTDWVGAVMRLVSRGSGVSLFNFLGGLVIVALMIALMYIGSARLFCDLLYIMAVLKVLMMGCYFNGKVSMHNAADVIIVAMLVGALCLLEKVPVRLVGAKKAASGGTTVVTTVTTPPGK